MGIGYIVRASCSGTSFYLHFQVSLGLYTVTERVKSRFHKDRTTRDESSL